jgi:hypothetical protein
MFMLVVRDNDGRIVLLHKCLPEQKISKHKCYYWAANFQTENGRQTD